MLVLERKSVEEGDAAKNGGAEAASAAAAGAALNPSRAIGVQLLRETSLESMAARGGGLLVQSGLSGNVRNPFGELMPVLVHPSLGKSDSELDLHGIGGKRQPPSRKRAPAADANAPDEATEAAMAAAAAAASAVRRLVTTTADDVLCELGYTSESVASGTFALHAGVPVVAVPSTLKPADSGLYRLRLLSDAPLAVVPVHRAAHTAVIDGAWTGGGAKAGGGGARGRGGTTAGGCHMEPTWGSNPQYVLDVGGSDGDGSSASVQIVLRRPEAEWEAAMNDKPVDAMIGFYVLSGDILLANPHQRLRLRGKAEAPIVHESCFALSLEVSCTLQLELNSSQPTTLVLLPTTYGAGQLGPFTIELASDAPLAWAALV